MNDQGLMSAERAQAIADVVSMLAKVARAVPVVDVSLLADDPGSPDWLRTFADFRACIEITAPPAPASMPAAELCSACAASEADHDGLCSLCWGLRTLASYRSAGAAAAAAEREGALEEAM